MAKFKWKQIGIVLCYSNPCDGLTYSLGEHVCMFARCLFLAIQVQIATSVVAGVTYALSSKAIGNCVVDAAVIVKECSMHILVVLYKKKT